VQSRKLECILIAAAADCALKTVHVLSGRFTVFLDYLKIVSVHPLNEFLGRQSKKALISN
jgi:hypothetical protein